MERAVWPSRSATITYGSIEMGFMSESLITWWEHHKPRSNMGQFSNHVPISTHLHLSNNWAVGGSKTWRIQTAGRGKAGPAGWDCTLSAWSAQHRGDYLLRWRNPKLSTADRRSRARPSPEAKLFWAKDCGEATEAMDCCQDPAGLGYIHEIEWQDKK